MLIGIVFLLGVVPAFESWQEAFSASARTDGPIVLYVSRPNCTFCIRFENEVLEPVMKSGEYTNVVFREFVLADDHRRVEVVFPDDKGKIIEYSINIVGTPTVLFFDQEGNEIAQRRVGYNSSQYGTYLLERSIKTAIMAYEE
jgi:thioredoxin-related protein